MNKLIVGLVGGLLLVACGSQTAIEAAPAMQVDPALQVKADAFVEACAGAVEFGATVERPECECLAASVVGYIDPESASKLFDDLTPTYLMEDAKRREDRQDRYWRDLIMGLSVEERPQWNAMFNDALPVCRGEAPGDA